MDNIVVVVVVVLTIKETMYKIKIYKYIVVVFWCLVEPILRCFQRQK